MSDLIDVPTVPNAAALDATALDLSAPSATALTPTALAGPTLEQFELARALVSKVAEITPMESSRYLSELLGSPVFLKCENLQRTGSYKIRGAYNRLAQLTGDERARGVVAASAGNHAQGVAFAARELGIAATIFMPIGVALPKLQATRNYGADVVLRGTTVEEPLRAAAEFAENTGAVLIPPFDHPDVVAGQGTLGLEMLDQLPDLDTVVVPIGGGGLISGVASALKQRAARDGRSVRIIGVQVANAAAYPVSLERGEPTTIAVLPTIADVVVTVTDDDTARALLVLLERAKLVVEPAGAVAVAAVMTGQVAAACPNGAGKTVVILSGGNIDPLIMERVISRGLAASERYLKLKLMLPDRPGQLARVAELISEANANVVEVLHTRHGRNALISEVELELSIETRGPEHVRRVLARLVDAGYEPRIDY